MLETVVIAQNILELGGAASAVASGLLRQSRHAAECFRQSAQRQHEFLLVSIGEHLVQVGRGILPIVPQALDRRILVAARRRLPACFGFAHRRSLSSYC